MVIILFFSIPVLGFALLVWALTGPAWHQFMLLTAGVLGGMGIFYSMRWIVRNEVAVKRDSRPLDIHNWHQAWPAAEFLQHFELYLRVRGWRIIEAKADGDDRFRLIADKSKGKDRVALLGVRPGQAATQADFNGLDAFRREQRATRAALVVDSKPSPQQVSTALSRNCLVLRFADLGFMENALNIAE